jgi:orotate phosphoribosyltransferase
MPTHSTSASKVAAMLLEIGAIKINLKTPYKWASGWNSPIYCDNRLSLSFPEVRSFIKNALCQAIKREFAHVEAIAGVATAGIPQGALVADALGLPFVYVRSSPKGHGMENLIEGKVTPGQKVVVIEDLVSTGGSSLKAAESLKAAGFEVLGMAAIFTYGFEQAEENFKSADMPLITLSNYHYLLQEALQAGTVTEEELITLKAWRVDPAHWGK